jgi:hypothetical protein
MTQAAVERPALCLVLLLLATFAQAAVLVCEGAAVPALGVRKQHRSPHVWLCLRHRLWRWHGAGERGRLKLLRVLHSDKVRGE